MMAIEVKQSGNRYRCDVCNAIVAGQFISRDGVSHLFFCDPCLKEICLQVNLPAAPLPAAPLPEKLPEWLWQRRGPGWIAVRLQENSWRVIRGTGDCDSGWTDEEIARNYPATETLTAESVAALVAERDALAKECDRLISSVSRLMEQLAAVREAAKDRTTHA